VYSFAYNSSAPLLYGKILNNSNPKKNAIIKRGAEIQGPKKTAHF
jgi:hypothetical protein